MNCNCNLQISQIVQLIVVLIVYKVSGQAVENVFWEVLSDPIVFGENVKLYCNTSSVQDKCDQCTKLWYGGTDLEILSFNGFSVDHSKFETTEDGTGFALIIKHFDESDVNKLYSCTFGFYFDKKELRLTNDYELQPTKDTINITQFINSSSMLNIQVDFKKVYPPPRCTVFINGDNLSPKLITKQHQVGIFYRVTVDFQHNLKPNHCMGKIQLDCIIGTRNTTVIASNLNSSCDVDYKNEQSQPLTTVIVEQSQPSATGIVEQSQPSTTLIDGIVCSVISSIAIIIIVVLVVLRSCRQPLMRRKYNNSNAQKGSSKAEKYKINIPAAYYAEVQKSLI